MYLDDKEFGSVLLQRRARSRYIRLRVTPKGEVVVTVPWLTPWKAGIAFLESKREWVRRTLERQSRRQDAYAATDPQEPVTDAYIARLRAEAKRTLPPRLAELAARHGFVYNKVFIRWQKAAISLSQPQKSTNTLYTAVHCEPTPKMPAATITAFATSSSLFCTFWQL